MRRVSFALVLSSATVAALRPATAAGDELTVVGVYEGAAAATTGTLGGDLDGSVRFRLGPAVSVDAVRITLDGDLGLLDPQNSQRDSTSMSFLGVGASIGYRIRLGRRLALVPRVGLRREWLYGSAKVVRQCDVTGACDGGFYREVPSYRSDGPTAGVSFELGMPHRNHIEARVGVVIEWQRLAIDVPGDGHRVGSVWTAGLSAAFGGYRD
jgi:hypothetical protein